jgi:cysteine desulfurase/selenocysteine lyase
MTLGETTRPDFPILRRVVNGHPLLYLDSAASSQKPASVIEAIRRYYEWSHANVHRSIHTLGEEATELYEAARDAVRAFVGARSREEIVFTRGTTEGINLIAQALGRTLVRGDEIIVTEMEHHSNLIPWQMLCRDRGTLLKAVPVIEGSYLDMNTFDRLLSARTRVVAVTHVSNVLGTINPVKEMIREAHTAGARVLLDAAQAVPHLPVNVRDLDCDFLAFSGHKMLGPTGIGVLYGRPEILESMAPFHGGGEMILEVALERSTYKAPPHRFEAGTPPIAGAVGLAAAVDYLERLGMNEVFHHEYELAAYARQTLESLGGVTVQAPNEIRGGATSFMVEGIHPHDLATILDREGIAIRAGHHCAQPLMKRLGVPATARASFHVYNTREDVDALAAGIENARRILGVVRQAV